MSAQPAATTSSRTTTARRILFDRNLDGRFGDTVTTAAGANAFAHWRLLQRRATGARRRQRAAPARCRNDKDGCAYYGRVGVDKQRGNIVVGVVGEFGKSEITDSVTAFSTTPASYTMTREIDWEASIRGRARLSPPTRRCSTARSARAMPRSTASSRPTNTANAFASRGERQQLGITGGGGIEQKLGRNFSIGLEYMYHQLPGRRLPRPRDAAAPRRRPTRSCWRRTRPAPTSAAADDKFRWHSLRATAAFRF